jgi:hypothetical protein
MSREGAVFFFFIFRTAFLFYFCYFIFMYIFYLFQFLTAINILMFYLLEKDCC